MVKRDRMMIFLVCFGLITAFLGCGGGGGGGSSDTGTNIIYMNDYTNRDLTKVYTFKETVVDTTDGQSTPSENTIIYSYDQHVATIPSKYHYTGPISGPYTLETIESTGADKVLTYLSSSGMIISDDSKEFTNIDSSSSTGVIPPDLTVDTGYPKSSTEDLFNSDPDLGTFGEKIGTKTTESTLKALGKENVTVPAGTFETVKTQESSTITFTFVGGTMITTTTRFIWYSNNIGVVKMFSNNTAVITAGSSTQTTTNTVTDELKNVSQ